MGGLRREHGTPDGSKSTIQNCIQNKPFLRILACSHTYMVIGGQLSILCTATRTSLTTWLSISFARRGQDELDKTVTMLYRPDRLCALGPLSCFPLGVPSSTLYNPHIQPKISFGHGPTMLNSDGNSSLSCPENPSTQHWRSLAPNTIKAMFFYLKPETSSIGYLDPLSSDPWWPNPVVLIHLFPRAAQKGLPDHSPEQRANTEADIRASIHIYI